MLNTRQLPRVCHRQCSGTDHGTGARGKVQAVGTRHGEEIGYRLSALNVSVNQHRRNERRGGRKQVRKFKGMVIFLPAKFATSLLSLMEDLWDQIHVNPFVLAPGRCEENVATARLQRHGWRWKPGVRFGLFQFLCLFSKATLEGAILADSPQGCPTGNRKKKGTKPGGRTETHNIGWRIQTVHF